MKKFKYIWVSIVGVILFLGLLLLHEHSAEYNNIMEKVVFVFPFLFYLIVAIVDAVICEQKTQFAIVTRNFYFVISGIIIFFGIVTTIYWGITGKTGTFSGTWIAWTYNYIGNFLLYLVASICFCVIGLLSFLYVRLVSYITLKLKESED